MGILETGLGIFVAIAAFIIVWKIFKKLIGAVILAIILLLFLYFTGFISL